MTPSGSPEMLPLRLKGKPMRRKYQTPEVHDFIIPGFCDEGWGIAPSGTNDIESRQRINTQPEDDNKDKGYDYNLWDE